MLLFYANGPHHLMETQKSSYPTYVLALLGGETDIDLGGLGGTSTARGDLGFEDESPTVGVSMIVSAPAAARRVDRLTAYAFARAALSSCMPRTLPKIHRRVAPTVGLGSSASVDLLTGLIDAGGFRSSLSFTQGCLNNQLCPRENKLVLVQ